MVEMVKIHMLSNCTLNKLFSYDMCYIFLHLVTKSWKQSDNQRILQKDRQKRMRTGDHFNIMVSVRI